MENILKNIQNLKIMATCSPDCVVTLTPYDGNCDSTPRLKTPARWLFYACNTALPSPLTAEALQILFTNQDIVTSPDLANFTANDPDIQEIQRSDCQPNLRRVAGREYTFQDRQGFTGSTGSPATDVPYADYAFWANKIVNSPRMNVMLQYCDGDTVIALDASGNPLSVDLFGFLNWDAAATPGGARPEIKQFSMRFNGDPTDFGNPPRFNVNQSTGDVTLI